MPSKETVMRKMLAVAAVAALSLTMRPASPTIRPSETLAALPAPPIEPVCIVIWGQRFCW
jgi:hypothetical protein